jgi:hypothetical protein
VYFSSQSSSNFTIFELDLSIMKDIPKWQQDLVLDRIEKATQNPERLLDWDKVSKTLLSNQTRTKSDIKKLRGKQFQRLTKF